VWMDMPQIEFDQPPRLLSPLRARPARPTGGTPPATRRRWIARGPHRGALVRLLSSVIFH